MPMEDLEKVKSTIDNLLADALAELRDPEAYAVRKMFNKIKQPIEPNRPNRYHYNYDTELFEQQPWDSEWES